MRQADAFVVFKEWLPDVPELGNTGLIDARNVLPIETAYKSFAPLVSYGDSGVSFTGGPKASSRFSDPFLGSHVVVAAERRIYSMAGSSPTASAVSATLTSGSDECQFALYERTIIIAHGGNAPLGLTIGGASSTTLSTTDTVPSASVVGVVGQFVMVGDLGSSFGSSKVRWCAVDDPTNWPTPGSATASATQAGEQELPSSLGEVTGIHGSDQHGIIFQRSGIHRVIYVGGSTVFQFDKISENIGMPYRHGPMQVGGITYFPSPSGFYKTDGTSVVAFGEGKVDRWFLDKLQSQINVWSTYDAENSLIYWAFPVSPASTPATRILIYSILEDRFSYSDQTCSSLVRASSHDSIDFGVEGFTDGFDLANFTGTAGSAVITSGEVEHVPGLFSTVQGVKSLVSGTAPSMTVALGTRNTQDPSALTFTSESTANSATGFSGFRSSARYHRARFTITGNFDKAQGYEWQAVPDGAR